MKRRAISPRRLSETKLVDDMACEPQIIGTTQPTAAYSQTMKLQSDAEPAGRDGPLTVLIIAS